MKTSKTIFVVCEESYEATDMFKAYTDKALADEVCESKNITNKNKFIWYTVKTVNLLTKE